MLVARDKAILIKIWMTCMIASSFPFSPYGSKEPTAQQIETRTDPGAFTYAKNDR